MSFQFTKLLQHAPSRDKLLTSFGCALIFLHTICFFCVVSIKHVLSAFEFINKIVLRNMDLCVCGRGGGFWFQNGCYIPYTVKGWFWANRNKKYCLMRCILISSLINGCIQHVICQFQVNVLLFYDILNLVASVIHMYEFNLLK